MTDLNEMRALKASFRGALDTASTLAAMREQVEGIDDHGDIGADLLEEFARLTTAHAVASAALRGLVHTMQVRRSAGTSA